MAAPGLDQRAGSRPGAASWKQVPVGILQQHLLERDL